MEDFMRPDRAKHAVLPISKFGIMQLTRQRMRPEMNINTLEICPACNGTGKISPSILLVEEIEKRLHYLLTHQHKNITVAVHPILYSHLTKGLFFSSIRHQWNRKYKTKIVIVKNNEYYFTEFHFFDSNDEEIKL